MDKTRCFYFALQMKINDPVNIYNQHVGYKYMERRVKTYGKERNRV